MSQAQAAVAAGATVAATGAWIACAAEDQTCSFSGTRSVRYGVGTAVVEKTFTGAVPCNNASFGDPAVGQVKSCAYAADAGWAVCAGEGQTCAFSGLRTVRYGAGAAVVEKTFSNGVVCDNQHFGDPAVGVVKTCSLQPTETAWVLCATEGGRCTFTGTHDVRYGTAERHVVKAFSGGVTCNNAGFGDPAVGEVKACWTAAATGTAPGPVDCTALLPLPALPASYKVVTSFCKNGRCARPDDDIDDTDALDEALNQAGGSFLVFPPGKYLISRSLRVKQAGVTLWGPGATIHATNPDDQSIVIEANDTSIYSFRLTAVTAQRGSRVEHTRIAVYGPVSVNPVVRNTVIRNNLIVNAGEPGSNLGNAATGAGIFIHRADGFLIAGNTVARTLADGIHLTGGARNGRVLQNTVRETGDDMIAMVSYAYPNPYANTAATIAPGFTQNLGTYQVRNILVQNNHVSAPYWGRGIAVVGGRDITIRANTLQNLPYGAAVLLARETQSGTYGLNNIVVEDNDIRDVQTLNPPYDFGNKFASHARTGHGAIEVQSSMFIDELAYPALVDGLGVANIAVRNNRITSSATPAVRLGVDSGSTWMMGPRAVTGDGRFKVLSFYDNRLTSVRATPMQNLASSGVATCAGNTSDGKSIGMNACGPLASPVATTGAVLSCPAVASKAAI